MRTLPDFLEFQVLSWGVGWWGGGGRVVVEWLERCEGWLILVRRRLTIYPPPSHPQRTRPWFWKK